MAGHHFFEQALAILGREGHIGAAHSAGVATVGDDQHMACGNAADVGGDVIGNDPVGVVVGLGVDGQPVEFVDVLVAIAVPGIVDEKV